MLFKSQKLLIILLLISSFGSYAQDDLVLDCKVPVCDIDQKIAELSSKNQNIRYNYANSMITTYGQTQDEATLQNLYAVANKLKDLSSDLKDEDWVWREANNLANTMVMGLAKYSEVKGDIISNYFKLLTTAQKRYEIIDFWTQKSKTIENVSILNELIIFAENAQAHSLTLGDEAWIPRAAGYLVSEITIKLTQLDPIHEGIYSVSLKNQDLLPGILSFDKIAILDSSSESNLVVVFYNSKFKRSSFVFKNSTIAGNTIKGKFISNADTSREFKINLNRKTGVISGAIISTDSTIDFSGVQEFSTREVFKGNTPYDLQASDAIGTFNGKIGTLSGTLSVKSFSEGIYSATFRTVSGTVKIDFSGKFYPKNGVLTLTNNNDVKLIISLREKSDGTISWTGYSFSSKYPSYISVEFEN